MTLHRLHDNRDLHGVLVGPTGKTMATSPPGSADAFPLALWLAAAGVESLEARTDARKTKAGADSYRHEGMVLEVSYEYSNARTVTFFGAMLARLRGSEPAPFTYEIMVARVGGSEFKIEEVTSVEASCELSCPPGSGASKPGLQTEQGKAVDCCGTSRTVHRLHGLLLKFKHSGTAGQFCFISILNHLLVALGSVTLLKTLLDYVWIYLFPLLGIADYTTDVFALASLPAAPPATQRLRNVTARLREDARQRRSAKAAFESPNSKAE